MGTDESGIYKDLTYKIIGALYAVHNELGSVHKEQIYHKAVSIELKERNIDFDEEKSLPVNYKSYKVGVYKPDFIVENKVILELKAVPIMAKAMFNQVFFYIKGTGYKLVLLANFGTSKLSLKRRIYT
jgi:GxxExxY protein